MLGGLVCVAIFIFENINHRFFLHDFQVYYMAAKSFTQEKQVYNIAFGLETGYYKYSPITLLLFVPYTAVSFEVARIFHFILLTICTLSSVILLYQIIQTYFFKINGSSGLLFLMLIFILNHLFRELHLGNINIVLVLLVTLAVQFSISGKTLIAGCLLGLVILTKPYFLLLLLPLIAFRKIKILLVLGLSLFIFLIIPAIFIGLKENFLLHQAWIKSMSDHSTYLTSTNTIEYLISKYIYTVRPGSLQNFIILVVGLLYIFIFWQNSKATVLTLKSHDWQRQSFIFDMFILTAIIPNLVITDTEHFLLSLPLIIFLTCYLYTQKNYVLTLGFVVLILFYGGNSTDLIGKKLSLQLADLGLLGLSNLALVLIGIYIYVKQKSIRRYQQEIM